MCQLRARSLDAVSQSLIQSRFLFRKPFKCLLSKYTSNEGVDDLLQREYE
jgi:hypothetical protein